MRRSDELDTLRALGADPLTLTWDVMFGVLGAIVLGALLAVGVAFVLSPLAPIGPAHQIDPNPGFAADWTVLATGLVVMIVGLGLLPQYWRTAPRPGAHLGQRSERIERGSRVVNAAARSGLPPSAVAGLRFALEPGRGRTSVPVRSALVGAVLAVVVVVTTLTFASGLNCSRLAPRPLRMELELRHQPCGRRAAMSRPRRRSCSPVIPMWPHGPGTPSPVSRSTVKRYRCSWRRPTPSSTRPSCRAMRSTPITRSSWARQRWPRCTRRSATPSTSVTGLPSDAPVYVPPTPLRVVGTATLPAIGTSGALHPSMGTGAMISDGIGSPAFKKAIKQSDPNLNGQDVEVVRFRRGVTAAAGLASLHKIVTAANKVMAADPLGQGDVYEVLGVQRPAEIVNYQSTGATPDILATGLAVGAVVALGLTLATSVRRRRRDFALLKTLGFTRYQLAVTVAWQASVAALVGIVIGVPLGIALGRWLWDLFARAIYAVPEASVPIVEVVLVALAALVLANLVAAVPGGMAARTRTALVLRAE